MSIFPAMGQYYWIFIHTVLKLRWEGGNDAARKWPLGELTDDDTGSTTVLQTHWVLYLRWIWEIKCERVNTLKCVDQLFRPSNEAEMWKIMKGTLMEQPEESGEVFRDPCVNDSLLCCVNDRISVLCESPCACYIFSQIPSSEEVRQNLIKSGTAVIKYVHQRLSSCQLMVLALSQRLSLFG